MITLAHAVPANRPTNHYTMIASYVLAALFVVMAVSQLFKFEDFVPLITSFGLGGGESYAVVLASVLVVAEVFALPFLLRMYVSPLFRIVSMILGWLVAAIWLYITTATYMSVNAVQDAGFLGSAVTVPFGWWSILFSVVLAVLAGWSSWGMWPTLPGRNRKKR